MASLTVAHWLLAKKRCRFFRAAKILSGRLPSRFADPWTVSGVCILVIWAASAYVLIALAGHFILHDLISLARWLGILGISLGVILAEETPARLLLAKFPA